MFNFEKEKIDSIEISFYNTYYENNKRMLKSNNEPLNGKYYFTDIEYVRYFKNGLRHRDDNLPAEIWHNGTVLYYVNDEPHRLDGQATIYSNGDCYWYINGKNIDNEFMNKWLTENNIPIDWKIWTENDKILFAIHWSDYNGE